MFFNLSKLSFLFYEKSASLPMIFKWWSDWVQ